MSERVRCCLPLDETVPGLQVKEGLLRDKVVVHSILLAGARAAGRVGDGEGEGVGVALEEETVEGALADAGRARDNDGTGVANYSMVNIVPVKCMEEY